jgi:hypothetical protein
MQNRLITVRNRLEKADISLDANEDFITYDQKEKLRWARYEYDRLAERLALFGEDIEQVEKRIEEGSIKYTDFIDLPDENYIKSVTAPNTKGLYEKSDNPSARGYRDDEDADRQTHSPRANHPGPMTEGREHAVAIRQERLAELDEILESKGYSRQTDWRFASAQDRTMVRQVMMERESIYDDLRGLQEDPGEVQQEIDASRTPQSPDDSDEGTEEDALEDADDANTDDAEDPTDNAGDDWDNPAPETDDWSSGDPGDGFGDW